MPLPIGEIVGDYEVIGVLGHGGMGTVYRVRNVISDRVEAMKVLLPNLADQPGLADRFQREIKVLAKLDHPNITALRTAFRAKDQLWMVMELAEGQTLEAILRERKLTVEEAVRYATQALDALGYAHQMGVVHRDLKPGNMILTPAGVIKITDFGIAHDAAESRMTATGSTVGSLPYMSPEQIQQNKVDPRSDLYSLGISLYELLTGKFPWDASSGFAMMSAHVMQQPRPPVELNPQIDPQLSAVILRSLAKNPAERFQSAQEFRAALTPAATLTFARMPVATPPPVPVAAKPTRKWPLVGAAAALAIGAAIVFVPKPKPEPVAEQPAKQQLQPPPAPAPAPAPAREVVETKPIPAEPKKSEPKKAEPKPVVNPAEKEWAALADSRDVAALADFRTRYPDSEYAVKAFARIQQVQWESAKASGDPARLRAYIESHPKSPFSPLATAEAERIERAAQSKAVLDVLPKVVATYTGRDMAGLKALWPTIPGPRAQRIATSFRNAKSIEMKLEPRGEVQFAGELAMVEVHHLMKIEIPNGEVITLDEDLTMTLRKEKGGWVIATFPTNRDGTLRKKKAN